MKQKSAKIMAILALIWILVSIVWTWLLVIFWSEQNTQVELTQEQIEQIMKMMEEQNNELENNELEADIEVINNNEETIENN